MKNVLRFTLAALALAGLSFTDATAQGILRSQRLDWLFPANNASGIQRTKALAAGGTDTTVWVGTEGWAVPAMGAASDTVIVGRFLVFVDSSAAYAVAQTTLTAVIDGCADPVAGVAISGSAFRNVNVQSKSFTLTPTTGDDVVAIPIYLPLDQGGNANGWATIPPFVRLRLATSAAWNAAGVAVQYLSRQ